MNGTMWDRVEARPVDHVNPQVWADFKGGLVKTAVYKRYRVKANEGSKEIFIDPTPTLTQCEYENRDGTQVRVGLAYDYLSSYLAVTSAGVAQTTFTADTDTLLLEDELFELDLAWRWLNSLGRDYGEEQREYKRALGWHKSQDGGLSNISMDARRAWRWPNIPESGVGL